MTIDLDGYTVTEAPFALVTHSHGVTLARLVQDTIRHLTGSQRTELNKLAAQMTTGQTSVTFAYAVDGLRAGGEFEVDDELVHVWESSTAAKTATVERAQGGTTAALHATNAIARVEPRFPRAYIIEALKQEIASWPQSVYRVYVANLALSDQLGAVDADGLLGDEDVWLLSAQRTPLSYSSDTWPSLAGARLERRQDADGFPSGYAFVAPAEYRQGRRISGASNAYIARVRAGQRWPTVAWTTATDLGTEGMPASMLDIAPYGAAARLLQTKEVQRTDVTGQGRSRPAEEVRVGEMTQVARALWDFRNQRLVEEAKSLLSDDGWKYYS